ncbi:unnamed protein product, partial [Staurois parvus]
LITTGFFYFLLNKLTNTENCEKSIFLVSVIQFCK